MVNNFSSNTPEIKLIESTVDNYFYGMHNGNVDRLRSAFHSQAHLSGYRNNKFIVLPLESWLSKVVERSAPSANGEAFEMSIESVKISKSVGTVIVKNLYMGLQFTDHLSIAKIDDKWLIMHKSFHHN